MDTVDTRLYGHGHDSGSSRLKGVERGGGNLLLPLIDGYKPYKGRDEVICGGGDEDGDFVIRRPSRWRR